MKLEKINKPDFKLTLSWEEGLKLKSAVSWMTAQYCQDHDIDVQFTDDLYLLLLNEGIE